MIEQLPKIHRSEWPKPYAELLPLISQAQIIAVESHATKPTYVSLTIGATIVDVTIAPAIPNKIEITCRHELKADKRGSGSIFNTVDQACKHVMDHKKGFKAFCKELVRVTELVRMSNRFPSHIGKYRCTYYT